MLVVEARKESRSKKGYKSCWWSGDRRERTGAASLKRCRSALIWTFWTSFDSCLVFYSLSLSLSLCSTTVTVVRLVCSCYLSEISILVSTKRTALPAFLFIAALSESQVLLFSNPSIFGFRFRSSNYISLALPLSFLSILFYLKIKCVLFLKCSENLKCYGRR